MPSKPLMFILPNLKDLKNVGFVPIINLGEITSKSREFIYYLRLCLKFLIWSPKLMKLFQFEAYLHLCHSFMLFWVMINFDFLAFNFLTLSENFLFLSSLFNDFQIDLLTKPSFSTVLINNFPVLSAILTRPTFFLFKTIILVFEMQNL